jgi:hypothetical protein
MGTVIASRVEKARPAPGHVLRAGGGEGDTPADLATQPCNVVRCQLATCALAGEGVGGAKQGVPTQPHPPVSLGNSGNGAQALVGVDSTPNTPAMEPPGVGSANPK